MRYSFFIKLNKKASPDDIRTLLDLFSQNYTEYYEYVLSFGSALQCKKRLDYRNLDFLDKNSVQASGHVLNFGKLISFDPGECVLTVVGTDWSIDDDLTSLIHVEQLKPNELALWNDMDIVPVPDSESDYINTLVVYFDEIMEETTKVLWGKGEADEIR